MKNIKKQAFYGYSLHRFENFKEKEKNVVPFIIYVVILQLLLYRYRISTYNKVKPMK